MKIPSAYLPVMPYLILKDARAFLNFSKKTFGAAEQLIVPRGEGSDTIMHGEIRIHDAVIMFADSTDEWHAKSSGMFIYVADVDSVYNRALEGGSKSLMEPVQQDYGYTGGFEDPYGNQWWIAQGE